MIFLVWYQQLTEKNVRTVFRDPDGRSPFASLSSVREGVVVQAVFWRGGLS
jgi:hypothetical protein